MTRLFEFIVFGFFAFGVYLMADLLVEIVKGVLG